MFARSTWTVSPGKARRVSAWQRSAMLRLTGLRSGLHEVDRIAGTGLEGSIDDLLDTLRGAVDREAARRKSALAEAKNTRRTVLEANEENNEENKDAESDPERARDGDDANAPATGKGEHASKTEASAQTPKDPGLPALERTLATEADTERKLVFARLQGLRTGLRQSARETAAGCEAQIDRVILQLYESIAAMSRPAKRVDRKSPLAPTSHLRVVETPLRIKPRRRRRAESAGSVRERPFTPPPQTFAHHPPPDLDRLETGLEDEVAISQPSGEDGAGFEEVLSQRYDALVGELTGRYGEILVGSGVDRRGLILKLFVAPGGGSWSIVAADGHGNAGVIGSGSDWREESEIPALIPAMASARSADGSEI